VSTGKSADDHDRTQAGDKPHRPTAPMTGEGRPVDAERDGGTAEREPLPQSEDYEV
jgi:hypothetical protein